MEAKVLPQALLLTATYFSEGELVLETTCWDYDHFRTLPEVVEYRGNVCGKTGWNSDRGYACYKSGVPIAYGSG